ncbi:CvpA family protein [Dongia deserti]|uniref:CvpA family protein n=1 Tax=Dongia deserti TaxID=2268030 RepID=UPI0013C537E5|nr:CvpA family protein [Dongia deserti]
MLAIIALSTLLALGRGFVKEVLSIFGWIGAAIGTFVIFFYVPQVRQFANQQIAEPLLADIAAAVSLFVILLIVLGFFNHAISSRVHASSLGPLDKSLGLVFGLARGIVLVALAHMAMADWLLPSAQQRPEVIRQARTEPYVAMAATFIKDLIPQDLKDRASAILDEGSKAVEQGQQLNDTIQKLSPQVPQPGGQPAGESPGDSRQNGGQGTQRSPAGNQDGQGEQSGYKDAERKDLERLIQGQSQ